MNKFKCTFTGLDEFTSLEKVEQISMRFPFVEWGVLLSTSENRKLGEGRYPSVNWIGKNLPKLKDVAQKSGCSIALHVCGSETKKLLSKSAESVALSLMTNVNRVQINFAYKEYQVQELSELCTQFSDKFFITQHNRSNADLYMKIKNLNHQVLFDASGGRGIDCHEWTAPLAGKVCGYAGGLGLENMKNQLESIRKVALGEFWIDMEGKIRTEDKFNLNICENILNVVEKSFEQ